MQPVYAVSRAIAEVRLMALLPEAAPQALGVYGLYASRRQVPAALRALLDLLVERFADPACWPVRPADPRPDTARARNRTA